MRLFGYYAFHSLKNQIKKLFKTWVLIFFVVCMLIGGLIGFGVATLEDVTEEQNGSDVAITEDTDYEDEVQEGIYDEEGNLILEDWEEEAMNQEQLSTMVEFYGGLIILAVFLFHVYSADKNGSRIFLPADVNLLFASPMKPQSVLMFRLMTQIGMVIFSSLYLAFQIPNLVLNVGLSIWAAVGIMATLIFTIGIAKLFEVLLYTVASTNTGVKKYLRRVIYGFGIVLVGGIFFYSKMSGTEYMTAAQNLLNHEITRYIPFWGWLKIFCVYCVEGNLLGALISLSAIVIGGIVLTVLIWRIKADFYEDAMAKSEELAERLELVQAEKSTGFVKRKKDRSEKLRRDGMKHGSGANVFFFRSMYNRFRFAHFGIFTKTAETYLVCAVGVAFLCRFVWETDGTLPVILTLAVFAFFRSMGNPLAEDTSKDFFRMIPESAGKKLFWSILGGTVNCLLDLIPALLAATLLTETDFLMVLAWIPFILSVDFYGTNVGAFIDLSVPVAAGKTIKQVVQIMFIYFGLLPDVGIMAVGFVFDNIAIAALIAALVNFGLGGIFLALTPLFIEPKENPVREIGLFTQEDKNAAKKTFSTLGLACFAITIIGSALQIGASMLFYNSSILETSWGVWVLTFAPLYLVAVPVGLLICKKAPGSAISKKPFGTVKMIKVVFISVFFMYGGNLIGTLLTTALGIAFGTSQETAVMNLAMEESLVMKILVMVILAPIIEEYIFRKQLIDRMNPYGEKLAVFTSALMFGLFHGNFSQFFYATGLGLVFGYVYQKTGRLRYSIGLHMGINFVGSVVSVKLLEGLNLELLDSAGVNVPAEMVSPALIAFICYVAVMILSALIGLVLFCVNSRKLVFEEKEKELPKGTKVGIVYGNVGMILFMISCLVMFVVSLL